MANEQPRPGPEKRTRTDIDRPAELERFSREWDVPVERIEQAIKAVGPLVDNVKLYLRIE